MLNSAFAIDVSSVTPELGLGAVCFVAGGGAFSLTCGLAASGRAAGAVVGFAVVGDLLVGIATELDDGGTGTMVITSPSAESALLGDDTEVANTRWPDMDWVG